MDTLTKMLVIIASINIFLFLGQMAILDINPDAGVFYNCQGGFLGKFEASSCTNSDYVLNISNTATKLPSGESSISPETGNIFTDAFTALKSWVLDSLGLTYIINIFGAPYFFLKAMNLPAAFVFAVGTLWYAVSFMVLVGWLLSR